MRASGSRSGRWPGPRRSRRQDGQALTETLVAGLALVPLLIGVAAIGKLLDVRHATIAASRTVAFECTVRVDECASEPGRAALQHEARRRHFMHDDREVLTHDAPPDRPTAGQRVAGWTDLAGRPLLDRPSHVTVQIESQSLDAPRSHLRSSRARIATAGVRMLDDVAGPGRFGLAAWEGLRVAEVRTRVAAGDLALAAPLTVPARTAVLADAWTASGPDGDDHRNVRARVEAGQSPPGLEPVADLGYAGVRALMLVMQGLQMEPAAGGYRHRWIDMDIVPADRRPVP